MQAQSDRPLNEIIIIVYFKPLVHSCFKTKLQASAYIHVNVNVITLALAWWCDKHKVFKIQFKICAYV